MATDPGADIGQKAPSEICIERLLILLKRADEALECLSRGSLTARRSRSKGTNQPICYS